MTQPTEICKKRLLKEFRDLVKNPIENIRAAPVESNILEWHFVINPELINSPYSGGFYHGIIKFPPNFPYKPPSLLMCTPNGRFKTNTRLCLSMSDFHPETWNYMWSVGTILMGFYSFMMEDTPTLGSLVSTENQKRRYAQDSLDFNCRDRVFCELFPDLVDLNQLNKERLCVSSGTLREVSTATSRVPGADSPSFVFVLLTFAFLSFLTWGAIAMTL